MGTWAIPYENLETACAFIQLMKEPWIAQVVIIPDCDADPTPPEGETIPKIMSALKKKPHRVKWDAPFLHQLAGNDSLSDELQELAQRKRKNFDIRLLVKRCVTKWVESEDGSSQPMDIIALKILRDHLGLRPLTPEEEKAIALRTKTKFRCRPATIGKHPIARKNPAKKKR